MLLVSPSHFVNEFLLLKEAQALHHYNGHFDMQRKGVLKVLIFHAISGQQSSCVHMYVNR
jgi:hypothetical protein